MALVLFTGTIATISNEVDWLIQHDMRVSPKGEMVDWATMETAARTYNLGHRLVSIAAMPVSSVPADHFAYRARMVDEFDQQYFLHINQWTGEVTGTTHPLTVQRFFRDLHRYLFMPNVIGLPIVSSLAFVLAVSLYTGLKTTRNWRTLATRVRFNKNLRTAIGDSHKAAGIWASWFFVIIVVTGVWYLAELLGRAGGVRFDPPGVTLSEERVDNFGDIIVDADASSLVAAAKKAYPELIPTNVTFPQSPYRPAIVSGRAGNTLVRERANRVFLDPVTAHVIAVHRAKEIGWLRYLNQIADPLHFGYFGGLPTKLVWFFFGAVMTGLSLSGVWLTYKRLKPSTLSKAQFATLPVLLGMLIAGYFWLGRYQPPSIPAQTNTLATKSISAMEGRIRIDLDEGRAPTGKITVIAKTTPGRANIASVNFSFSDSAESVSAVPTVMRSQVKAIVSVNPHTITNTEFVDISLEYRSGRIVTQRWRLSG